MNPHAQLFCDSHLSTYFKSALEALPKMTRWRRAILNGPVFLSLLFAGLSFLPSSETLGAQPQMVGAPLATRAELAIQVASLEQKLASNARGADRERTQQELAGLRERLERGDFKVGDQMVVTTNRPEGVQVDTASVRDSLVVSLGALPEVSLKGVLRSELTEKLQEHVSAYIKNATVRSNLLMRLLIIGAVGRPGPYLASPDRPLSDLLMVAGGPTGDANLNEIEVTRGGKRVLSAKDSRAALKDGRTLAQADLRSGDEVRIPKKRKINWQAVIQVAALTTTLLFAFISFLRFYYDQQANK